MLCSRHRVLVIGLYTVMVTIEFISFLKLARDVHPILTRYSKRWQANDIDLTVVEEDVKELIGELEVQMDTPGEQYASRLAYIAEVEKALDIKIGFGHPSRAADGWLDKWRKHFLRQLVQEIKERFPDTPTLKALGSVFMLKNYPAHSTEPSTDTLVCVLAEQTAHLRETFSKEVPASSGQTEPSQLFTEQEFDAQAPAFLGAYYKATHHHQKV